MQFNSYIFILLFLPVSFAAYFLLNRWNHLAGKLALIAAGAAFYAYAGLQPCICLAASIIINYFFSIALSRARTGRKILLGIVVVLNVFVLIFFKYRDFYVENFGWFVNADSLTKDIILPLGISFFTFQQIAWVVGVYRQPSSHTGIVDYLLYVLYFPKLIMGPITEPALLLEQFNDSARKRPDPDNLACGARIFAYGLFKKTFFADTFAAAASWGLSNCAQAGSAELFITMLSCTLQLYFDFSGYSDMATGISQMLNIELPINFNSPYKALSIRDFWKRWHISLTSFLTKYIYFPLGGSRKGMLRTQFNVMVVFIVSGIWHGANWTFILWGFLNGALSVAERLFERRYNALSEPVRWGLTFLSTNLLFLLFSCDSIGQWVYMLKNMLLLQNAQISPELISVFILPETIFFSDAVNRFLFGIYPQPLGGLWMLLFFIAALAVCMIPENNYNNRKKLSPFNSVAASLAFVWGLVSLGGESTFVYFGF